MKLLVVLSVFPGILMALPAAKDLGSIDWQQELDQQLMKGSVLKDAAIADLNGDILAKSSNFNGSPSELTNIVSGFSNPERFQQNGIFLGGTKYIYLSGTDRVMRGKKGKAGIHIMKTDSAVIVGTYDEPTIAQQAAVVVEKFGDSLLKKGF